MIDHTTYLAKLRNLMGDMLRDHPHVVQELVAAEEEEGEEFALMVSLDRADVGVVSLRKVLEHFPELGASAGVKPIHHRVVVPFFESHPEAHLFHFDLLNGSLN